MAFTVDAAGKWTFSDYRNSDFGPFFGYIDGGQSSAAHLGDGAPNTLLLLMRGDAYLLYANDQFLDVASQQYDDPKLTQGHVGVFVSDAAVTGSFTNFVVYEVQPQTSANWV